MTPRKFEESNKILLPAKGTEDSVGNLSVFTDGEQCISCWRLSWRERFSALFFGRAWLYVISGDTQPPLAGMVRRSIFTTKQQ